MFKKLKLKKLKIKIETILELKVDYKKIEKLKNWKKIKLTMG